MMDAYAAFLERKTVEAPPDGIDDVGDLPDYLKPFQQDITRWALRRGRAAVFAGTGLGKTRIQLVWADRIQQHTGEKILVLTPLAVAQQTIQEAAHVGIEGVGYSPDQYSVRKEQRIVVTNYDRFHHFDVSNYSGIVLDESGIIKSHDSKTRKTLIETCREMRYKLCCTATPAPNDWIELGNHAEFLGVMTEKEMLAMFFVHDGSVRAHAGASEWRLKGHSETAFWKWLASWAVMIRSPQDLGYDEPSYVLPPLHRHQVTVPVEYIKSTETLFPMEARTMQERLRARRDSIDPRVKAAADIINAQQDRPWLVWCGLNDESTALTKALKDAVEVRGSDDADVKSNRLLGFCQEMPRVLVTKAKIGGFGMNWQHCADMVFVGVNDSFEQMYQAIRRCWRFGQTRPVNVYLIASELEGAVVSNVDRKELAFEGMQASMAEHMLELTKATMKRGRVVTQSYKAEKKMEIPAWLEKGKLPVESQLFQSDTILL